MSVPGDAWLCDKRQSRAFHLGSCFPARDGGVCSLWSAERRGTQQTRIAEPVRYALFESARSASGRVAVSEHSVCDPALWRGTVAGSADGCGSLPQYLSGHLQLESMDAIRR